MMGAKTEGTLTKLLILLSILLHIQAYLAMKLMPSDSVFSKKPDIIEFEIQEKQELSHSKKEKRSYLKDFDLQQKVENLQKKANFLSRKTRRVKDQTIARSPGIIKNRSAKQSSKVSKKNKELLKRIKKSTSMKLGNHQPSDIKNQITQKDQFKPSINLTKSMRSSFSFHLPTVQKADVTALNTDQGDLAHYSFYVRNYEKYYPRWVRNIENLSKLISAKQAKFISKQTRITELQLILDKTGAYVGHLITKKSGDRMVDFTVTDALKLSTPFNNPPKDLIEEDGFIYLEFRFRLEYNPRLFAKDF